MKLKELLRGIEVLESNAPLELDICGVSSASQNVCAGGLFVAVVGYVTDGHRYIPDAVAHGAVAVLCEREAPLDVPYIKVADTRKALAQLGVNWNGDPSAAMTVIGVTGTNGKTSVTTLLKTVLEKSLHAKVGLIGTVENKIGAETLPSERTTPESFELQGLLAQMREAGCTHAVMEVSSHALALHRVDGVRFDIGAFTNLTEDHLDFHHTMEEYRRAKAKLFRQCQTGVFDLDSDVAPRMIADASCRVFTVGLDENADLRGEAVHLAADRIEMDVRQGSERAHLRLGIPGRFTVSNALVVLGIAHCLGIALPEAVAALSEAKGVKGRIEVVPTPDKPYTVLIDYAHTPDGLENVLRSVRDFCTGRLIVLFGCGGDRDRSKRPIMGEIAVRCADFVIVTSDNPRTEDPIAIIEEILAGMRETKTPYLVEPDRRRAIRSALRYAKKDDIIVLAGKGHETHQILGKEKVPLDEREEVAAALCEIRE